MTDEKPNPSEVEPISESEAVYQRDAEGNLKPIANVIETPDGYRRIKIEPTPKGEAMEFEDKYGGKEDIDVSELDEILNDKVVEPGIDWSNNDVKPGIYIPVIEAVVQSIMGEFPDNQFHEEVRRELEERRDEGNLMP